MDQIKFSAITEAIGHQPMSLLLRAVKVFDKMEAAGFERADLVEYIEYKTKRVFKSPLQIEGAPCPDCGKALILKRICTPKGRGNIYGYKSKWVCQNDDCVYEKFNYEAVNEIREGLEK